MTELCFMDKQSSKITLGEYIARLRDEKGWSQRELARRVSRILEKDFSQAHMRRLELNETESPGIKALSAVAIALGVPPTSMMLAFNGIDPDRNKSKPIDDPYKQAVKDFFRSLPKEDRLELAEEGSEYFKNELLKVVQKKKSEKNE